MKRLALEKLSDCSKITIEAMTLLDLDLNGVQMSISQVLKKRRIIVESFSRYLICFHSGEIFFGFWRKIFVGDKNYKNAHLRPTIKFRRLMFCLFIENKKHNRCMHACWGMIVHKSLKYSFCSKKAILIFLSFEYNIIYLGELKSRF